jgi:hypothetical protein
MRNILLAPTVAVFLAAASVTPSFAQEKDKGADVLAVEGLKKLMDALSVFIDAIPQYATPEMMDNGDIIIRRKNKEENHDKDGDSDSEKPKVEETNA